MATGSTHVTLEPLRDDDREQFVLDNQRAFNYGALEEFGCRDAHFEEDGQIISRETIERSIDEGEAYRIVVDGEKVGGVVLKVEGDRGELDLLFVVPGTHSKGVGQAAWRAVEKLHPEVRVWGLVTPYFEKRNIHFYVNRCGFHIVEFFNSHHPDPNALNGTGQGDDEQFPDGMFRFEKVMWWPGFLLGTLVKKETVLSSWLQPESLACFLEWECRVSLQKAADGLSDGLWVIPGHVMGGAGDPLQGDAFSPAPRRRRLPYRARGIVLPAEKERWAGQPVRAAPGHLLHVGLEPLGHKRRVGVFVIACQHLCCPATRVCREGVFLDRTPY